MPHRTGFQPVFRALRLLAIACSALALAVMSAPGMRPTGFAWPTAGGTAHAAPGDLDATFGMGGQQMADLPAGTQNFDAYELTIAPDGTIWQIGRLRLSGDEWQLAALSFEGASGAPRLLPDRPDTASPVLLRRVPGGSVLVNDATVQPDGKPVMVGSFSPTGSDRKESLLVARLSTDGAFDTSFGTGGFVTANPGALEIEALGVAMQGAKVIVAGILSTSSDRQVFIARYGADGSLDHGFAGQGFRVFGQTAANDWPADLAILPDGRILVAGTRERAGQTDVFVARLNRDGALDPAFGTGGIVMHDLAGLNEGIIAMDLAPDGAMVLSGWRGANAAIPGEATEDALVLRLNADGSIDTRFDRDGWLAFDGLGALDRAEDVAVLADGRIAATVRAQASVENGGAPGQDFLLYVFRADGNPDIGFATNGRARTDFINFASANDAAFAMAVQVDGKIVQAGYSYFSPTVGARFSLARYEAPIAGNVDPPSTQQTANRLWRHYAHSRANAVTKLWVDEPGRTLLAATPEGLVTWDLARSQYRLAGAAEGYPTTVFDVAHEAGVGTWLAAGRDGLMRLNPDGVLVAVNEQAGLPKKSALRVFLRRPGGLWVLYADDDADGDWCGGVRRSCVGASAYERRPDDRWVPVQSADGQVRTGIVDLLDARDGRTWIATREDGVLVRSDEGGWTELLDANRKRLDAIVDLAEGDDGAMFFARRRGEVLRQDPDGRWHRVALTFDPRSEGGFLGPCASNDTTLGILPGGGGSLWALTAGCIVRIGVGDQVTGWSFPRSQDALVDQAGDLWAVGDGVAHIEAAPEIPRVSHVHGGNGLAGGSANDVFEDHAGRIWVATDNGISVKPQSGDWQSLYTNGTLPSDSVSLLAQDSRGAVLVGTPKGLTVIDATGQVTDDSERLGDEVAGLWPTAYLEDRSGNQWFGTMHDGALRISPDGQTTQFRRRGDGLPSLDCDRVNAIHEDAAGNIWFATSDVVDGGAYRLAPDGSWTVFNDLRVPGRPPPTILSNDVRDLAEDGAGNMWFVTSEGVSRLSRDGGWTARWTAPEDRASSVLHARDGSLWFGTGNGLLRLQSDGSETRILAGRPVAGAAEAADGSIWFAAGKVEVADEPTEFPAAAAIVRWRPDGELLELGQGDGVPSGGVGLPMVAADQSIWMATGHGVSVTTVPPPSRSPLACQQPNLLPRDTVVEGVVGRTDNVVLHAIDVSQPYSHVTFSVEDPQNRFDIAAFKQCDNSILVAGASSGAGRHIGAGRGRHENGRTILALDTGAELGRYFVTVAAGKDQQAFPARYRLVAKVNAFDRGRAQALFLTHRNLIELLYPNDPASDPASAPASAWWTALEQVAARTAGEIVDIADIDPQVQAAADRYTAQRTDVGLANAYALALQDWIWRQRSDGGLSSVRYVVLVGDDRVIPHYRQPIRSIRGQDPQWISERDYLPDAGIAPGTSTWAALQLGDHVLTDDLYATPTLQRWHGESTMPIPEIGVGRLVESPSQIRSALLSFTAAEGRLDVHDTLTAGWDHMADGPREGNRVFAALGLRADRRAALDGEGWTADDLVRALQAPMDLAYLGVHANHFVFQAPDRSELGVERLAGLPGLAGSLIYTLACHGGLNVPGTVGHAHPADFPEVMLAAGSTYVGSTGWAYGQVNQLGYQEALMTDFTRRLASGAESVAVGDALVAAKQAYFMDHEMDHYDAKTLVGTVLYGLPMTRIAVDAAAPAPFVGRVGGRPAEGERRGSHAGKLPAARAPSPPSLASPLSPLLPDHRLTPAADAIHQGAGESFAAASFTFRDECEWLRQDSPEGSYFSCGSDPVRAQSGDALQPRIRVAVGELRFKGESLPARSLVVSGVRYHAVPGLSPIIEQAGLLGAAQSFTQALGSAWTPSLPAMLRSFARTPLVGNVIDGAQEAQLLLTFGQHHPILGAQRLIDEISIELLYSSSADVAAPEVATVAVAPDGTVHARVTDSDSGIWRVYALCDDARGRWQGIELQPAGAEWRGPVSPYDTCVIQAIDRAGNVRLDDRAGRLYDVGRPGGGPVDRVLYLPIPFGLDGR